MTKPLFLQINPPKLESQTGIQHNRNVKEFHIDSQGKDSVDISFLISVPKEMLSEKWAISLTPTIISVHNDYGRLKDVVVKGWQFAEAQDEDYEKYNDFINSIVDTSMYSEKYIDQERLQREIEHRHDEYWKFYYDEWERQIEYEIWKSKQDGSIKTFSVKNKMEYKDLLLNQYLLRIENQSKRYLSANMDTTGLYAKYIREFEEHNAKMPRFIVDENIALNKVPRKYRDIYNSGRTLNDITDSMLELLVKRDSALMSLPVLDYKRIIENEKRTMLQDGIFEDIISLPKNENALLDTVIYDTHSDYSYLYTYRYLARNDDTIKVRLQSRVLATDRSGYSTSSEDILTYIISKEENTTKQQNITEQFTDEEKEKKQAKSKRIVKESKSIEEDESIQRLLEKLQKLGTPPQDEKKTNIEVLENDSIIKYQRPIGTRIQVIE